MNMLFKRLSYMEEYMKMAMDVKMDFQEIVALSIFKVTRSTLIKNIKR